MRRHALSIALTFVVSMFAATGGAQAVVVNDGGNVAGVALVPGTRSDLTTAGVSTVTSGGSCSDPWLASDLGGPFVPSGGLCWHGGGAVTHGNETFALTWDQHRLSWPTTTNYVEQFLRDVADGTGTLTSPYAVTTQYQDGSAPAGRAGNRSVYGGGCIDFGSTGGSTCRFGSTDGSGTGRDYPSSGCPTSSPNQYCLTDAQLQQYELTAMIQQMGVSGRTQPGYTPLVVLLTPPGVEVCLDSAGHLCSANGASTAQFCSYHSHVNVPGAGEFAYIVQPWTVNTACDEPELPSLPANPTPEQLQTDAGVRLVSPLSQAQIAAIVNPLMNGWFANDGSEISDNAGCRPLGPKSDTVTVGTGSHNPYVLQREFNNAGLIDSNPNTYFGCAPDVLLASTFVVPSAVDQGDLVQFDGSTSVSTLIVPKGGYVWDFGDGTTGIGPSVVHSYRSAGSYSVKLTVTDRGGNVSSLSQTIAVLGATGRPVSPSTSSSGLHVRIQLMPQSLRSVLRGGVAVRVTSNERANGIVTLSISRGAARRAHLRTGRGPLVAIGRGTVSGIAAGTVNLRLRMSQLTAAKLGHLRHVAVTVRLSLVAASGDHLAIDAAGRY
jgi:hypothetical protein